MSIGIRSSVPADAEVIAVAIDDALSALVARHRAAEIDATYAAYDRVPLEADDEWGSLASFRRAAGAS